MRNILLEIKWAYQRIMRGYDDRIHWGFDEYFKVSIDPLYEFCMQWASRDYAHLNPKKLLVFANTIILIDEYRKVQDTWREGNEALSKLLEHVGKHIGYYWD